MGRTLLGLRVGALCVALLAGCGRNDEGATSGGADGGGGAAPDGADAGGDGGGSPGNDAAVATGALQVAPARLDFDPVAVGERDVRTLIVSNVGEGTLSLQSARLDGDSAFSVRLRGAEDEALEEWLFDPDANGVPGLAPGASIEVEVVFAPLSAGLLAGALVAETSDPEQPTLTVPFAGRATEACLVADPAGVDFQGSLIGRADERLVRFFGCEGAAVSLTDLRLEGPDADAFTLEPAEPLAAAAPSERPSEVRVRFAPAAEGVRRATLVAEARSGLRLEVQLLGRGVPNACPEARVARDEFVVEPLGRASLDGSPSLDRDGPGGAPAEYRWIVTERPDTSRARVAEGTPEPGLDDGAPDDVTTPEATLVTDLIGRYTVELVVVDDLGLDSTQCGPRATVTVVVAPRDGLHVQASFGAELAEDESVQQAPDVDLHLLHPSARGWLTSPFDLGYRNANPDWGDRGRSVDDPVLLVDAHSGVFVEHARLEVPQDTDALAGTYDVGLHYYTALRQVGRQGDVPVSAALQVYLNGALAFDNTARPTPDAPRAPGQVLRKGGDLWCGARVRWDAAAREGSVERCDQYLENAAAGAPRP